MGTNERRPVHERRALFGEHRHRHRVFAELRREGPPAPARTPPAPYVTISVGGPLDGSVTLTSQPPRVLVEASWDGGGGDRRRIALTRPCEREALLLADRWANELIDGREPTGDPLPAPPDG
jgi:hypothetical protein